MGSFLRCLFCGCLTSEGSSSSSRRGSGCPVEDLGLEMTLSTVVGDGERGSVSGGSALEDRAAVGRGGGVVHGSTNAAAGVTG
jgi:hypothetical protein